MAREVLTCPTDFYAVKYKINPWMDPDNPANKVDPVEAKREHDILLQTFLNLGRTVHQIAPDENQPDMIYAANYGHPILYDEAKQKKTGKRGLFIKANFKHDERKGEARLAKNYFLRTGFDIAELPEDITWEGQGDLIKVGNLYVLGYGQRSDKRAIGPLAEILEIPEKEILQVQMIDGHFYHIDTALGALDDPNKTTAVVNKKAFNDEDFKQIRRNIDDLLETNDQDNRVLGANLVSVGKVVVLAKGISNELKQQFDKRGFGPIEIPMDQSLRGGGAVKCNTLEYYQS